MNNLEYASELYRNQEHGFNPYREDSTNDLNDNHNSIPQNNLSVKSDIDRILIEFFNAFMLKRIGFKVLKTAFFLWTINSDSGLERLKGIWL